jgi:hypothetical protein
VSEPHGRAEDRILAALDDDAAIFSQIAGAVAVIAAHRPNREIRQELRTILDALADARCVRRAGREAYRGKQR